MADGAYVARDTRWRVANLCFRRASRKSDKEAMVQQILDEEERQESVKAGRSGGSSVCVSFVPMPAPLRLVKVGQLVIGSPWTTVKQVRDE